MTDFRFLNQATDDSFRAAALADYMESCAQAYQDLIAAVTEASLLTPDDSDDSDTLYNTDAEIDSVLENYGYTGDETVTLSNGYVTVRSLLSGVARQMEAYADPMRDNPTALIDNAIPLLKGNGEQWTLPSGFKATSVANVLDDLKSSLHSNVVTVSALRASVSATISERVTVFTDSIKQVFADAFTDFSATASYMRTLLSDESLSAADIAKAIVESMGNEARAANPEVTVEDSPLSEFTGASPVATIDFTSACKVVGAVGTVIAGAVGGILKGIWSVTKPLFSKAVKTVKQLYNPYDLEVKNDSLNAAPSVNGWMIQGVDDVAANATTHRYEGQWMKYETIFGEVLTRVSSHFIENDREYAHVEYQAKPYVLNVSRLAEIDATCGGRFGIYVDTGSDSTGNFTRLNYHASYATIDEALPFIDLCKEDVSSIYADIDQVDELSAYYGLLLGRRLLWSTFFITYFPNWDSLSSAEKLAAGVLAGDHTSFEYKVYEDAQHAGRYPVTNAMWIKAASCWNGDTTTPTFSVGREFGTNVCSVGAVSVAFLLQQDADRAETPLSWTFIPYRNNITSFKLSKYGVRTDSANQRALTVFCTAVTAAVIIIAAAITVGVVAKKIARAKFWKRQKFVGQFDNATWNGQLDDVDPQTKEPVWTKRDYRKYIRYSRKLNASSLLTSGLQETGSSTISGILSNMFSGDSAPANGLAQDSVRRLLI